MHSPTTCLEDLSRIHNLTYLEKTFTIAGRLQEMDLSVEETVVMASFAVLFPGIEITPATLHGQIPLISVCLGCDRGSVFVAYVFMQPIWQLNFFK